MGTIFYGNAGHPIHLEDRALAHLKVVIAVKLRRSESFTVSWNHPDGERPGKSTIWLHPSIPLRFVLDDAEPIELNRQWIDQLAQSAHSAAGVQLTPEQVQAVSSDAATNESAAMTLGTVEVEDLDVGKLTVGGTEITPELTNG
ncbi:hypothetical protein ACFUTX_00145 [Microbacterium sp. NPDC057407]|uniref:DUF7882 family protein n=1 Tax=Microbacterium sp. NPDC057407 TaxID=3346120 RepID=UPI0036714590